MPKRRHHERGITLIEVTTAMTLIGLSFLASYSIFSRAVVRIRCESDHARAREAVLAQMDLLTAIPAGSGPRAEFAPNPALSESLSDAAWTIRSEPVEGLRRVVVRLEWTSADGGRDRYESVRFHAE